MVFLRLVLRKNEPEMANLIIHPSFVIFVVLRNGQSLFQPRSVQKISRLSENAKNDGFCVSNSINTLEIIALYLPPLAMTGFSALAALPFSRPAQIKRIDLDGQVKIGARIIALPQNAS